MQRFQQAKQQAAEGGPHSSAEALKLFGLELSAMIEAHVMTANRHFHIYDRCGKVWGSAGGAEIKPGIVPPPPGISLSFSSLPLCLGPSCRRERARVLRDLPFGAIMGIEAIARAEADDMTLLDGLMDLPDSCVNPQQQVWNISLDIGDRCPVIQ